MIYCIFDIETDGLIETATKIHCLSYRLCQETSLIAKDTLTDYNAMRIFISSQSNLVGHNIVRFDIPILEKFLDMKIQATLIDTLGLSWYLFSTENRNGKIFRREKHGLESWGEELGVKKPFIEDWKNQSIEDYIFRCESDVRINSLLFQKEMFYLKAIYENDMDKINSLIAYLTFKLDCAREQEENPCHINKEALEKHLIELTEAIDLKTEELSSHMPLAKIYKTVKKPSPERFFKKDGSLSIIAEKWIALQKEYNLSDDVLSFDMLVDALPGNPNSTDQLKDWLLSLGWKPTFYKDSTSKVSGATKKVPQVLIEDKTVCPNIRKLYAEHPYLENIEGFSLLNHRKGMLQSFMDALQTDNTIKATIGGFTSTLRMQHRKPLVNLPKVGVFYGEEIRGLIIAPDENHFLCGSDMTSLEDTTKQHYMYFFDPEYVKEMRIPGFDPHLDVAVLSELMTTEEAELFKQLKKKHDKSVEETALFQKLSELRYNAKTVNFAGIYGAGPPKIAETLGVSLDFATKLHTAYWKRNKAVKQVSASVITKTINGNMWLYNPVSTFWYPLRYEKDIFSGLNQSTGVYCFDKYLMEIRRKGIKVSYQYHDELMVCSDRRERTEDDVRNIIEESINIVNNNLKLNVPLGSSVDFGNNYAEIH